MQTVRTRRHNIISHLPGVVGDAKQAKSVLQTWSLFFTDEMLAGIVEYTNIYIDLVSANVINKRKVRPMSLVELKCLIGLLYLLSIHGGNRINLEEFWADDGLGMPRFIASMSLNRFRFLLRMLRFDDKRSRQERREKDLLCPVREIFERFVSNCRQHYCVGEYVTLDEMLWAFRGKCPFRIYMPNKPAKYGIKVYALVDARMNYTTNLEIYSGKQPSNEFLLSNKPDDVVERLCKPLSKSKRNITMDNWFTSYPIAMKMLREYDLTIVGTVKKNKPQLPNIFINPKNRERYSSLFGFQESATLVSYIPNKNKNVILMSTMHHSGQIDESTKELKKPEIITFYNSTKAAVDVVDGMCVHFNVSRNSRRWPLTVFYQLLNIGGINANIIFKANNQIDTERRHFIKELGNFFYYL